MQRLALPYRMAILTLTLVAPRWVARRILSPLPPFGAGGEPDLPAQVERVFFPSASGQLLRGWWLHPQGTPAADAAIVLAHGWTGFGLRMQSIAAPLLHEGYQVLLYDARSHGDSDPYDYCSMLHFAQDVAAATQFANERASRVAVVGHSLGAAGALVAAADGAPTQAVVAMAPPAHPIRGISDLLYTLGVPGEFVVRRVLPYFMAMVECQLETFTPELRLKDVTCPVMLMHGTEDDIVPVSHFQTLKRVAGDRAETYQLEGCGHDLLRGQPEVTERILPFLRQHLPV